jgi:hypothetical protein
VSQSPNIVEPVEIDLTGGENPSRQILSKYSLATVISKFWSTMPVSSTRPLEERSVLHPPGTAFNPEYLVRQLSLHECFTKAYDVNVAGNSNFDPAVAGIQSTTDLRGLIGTHQPSQRGILCHPASASWMAEEDRIRDHWIPLQQDRSEYAHAGLEPPVQGGRGERLVCGTWVFWRLICAYDRGGEERESEAPELGGQIIKRAVEGQRDG